MIARKRLALGIAILAFASPTLSSFDLPYVLGLRKLNYSGVVRDAATKLPLAGVHVVATYGIIRSSLATSATWCQEVRATTTGVDGRFSFPVTRRDGVSPMMPRVFLSGYYTKFEVVPPVWVQKRQEERAFTNRDIYLARQDPEHPEYRITQHLDCVDMVKDPEQRRILTEFDSAVNVAVAREAIASSVESDRLLGLQFCRQAAWGTAYIEEQMDRSKVGRFIYTRAEATRLRELAPECLGRAVLLAGMRQILKDTGRPDALADEDLLVKRAIVDNAAASQARAIANRTNKISRYPSQADGMTCAIKLGMPERIDEFERRLRERSLKFRRDASTAATWFGCEDQAVLQIASDVTSDQ